MRAADLLVKCLENEDVKYVFGVPGEETLDLVDALSQSKSVRWVTCRHESAAAFMADVWGRLTTYPGVCCATLGPGATNLLTGVGDAHLDRAPLVAITGQAGLDRAFKESHQYVDIVGMFRPVTKWNARIELPQAIPEMVRKAFRVARIEKPGATHLELPEDVAEMDVAEDVTPMEVRRTTYPSAELRHLERAAAVIHAAKRPVILAGNGVIRRQAAAQLLAFARRTGVQVTHTFMGKGSVDARDPLALAAVGFQSEVGDIGPMKEADCVIAVGYDLVEWSPDRWNRGRDKEIVHVDSTPAEVDTHYLPAVEVVGEIKASLEHLAELCEHEATRWEAPGALSAVRAELDRYQRDDGFPLKPQRVMWELRDALGDDDIVVSDVGVHKLWVGRYFPAHRPNTVVISNGFASMGIGVPGGIAAKLAHPTRKVVVVTGDGGFAMNSQELETAKRLGTPFVTMVLNDGRYGVIELNQKRRFGRAFGIEFGNPDFVTLARAFGISGYRVSAADDLGPTLRKALKAKGPTLIDVPIDPAANARVARPLEG